MKNFKNQAESFSEQANSAETELQEIANDLSAQAKEAQSLANASNESAKKENTEMKAAMEQARQDAELVKNLETSDSSGSEMKKAKEKARQSMEEAKQAGKRFSIAQKQADIAQTRHYRYRNKPSKLSNKLLVLLIWRLTLKIYSINYRNLLSFPNWKWRSFPVLEWR